MRDPTQDGELEETETVNVVPLADLTLVLLIILMVLAPMITQSMIHVSAPGRVETAGPPEDPLVTEAPPVPLVIELTRTGIRLDNQPMADTAALLAAVRDRLSRGAASTGAGRRGVIVAADKDIRVGQVVEVLDGAKSAGAGDVALVRPGEGGPP